jgi:hypothetical protein
MPGFAKRCRQLTQARADNPWLAAGSIVVQQQAIRDHAQAMARFFAGTHRRPRWRKRGQDEGFRVVAVDAVSLAAAAVSLAAAAAPCWYHPACRARTREALLRI